MLKIYIPVQVQSVFHTYAVHTIRINSFPGLLTSRVIAVIYLSLFILYSNILYKMGPLLLGQKVLPLVSDQFFLNHTFLHTRIHLY